MKLKIIESKTKTGITPVREAYPHKKGGKQH